MLENALDLYIQSFEMLERVLGPNVLKEFKTIKNSELLINPMTNIGMILFKMGSVEESLNWVEKSIKIAS